MVRCRWCDKVVYNPVEFMREMRLCKTCRWISELDPHVLAPESERRRYVYE